jgi:hypothetical protein
MYALRLRPARKERDRFRGHRKIIATVALDSSKRRKSRNHRGVVNAMCSRGHDQLQQTPRAKRGKFLAKMRVRNHTTADKQRLRCFLFSRALETIDHLCHRGFLETRRKICATRVA